jgi:hypothetical protein
MKIKFKYGEYDNCSLRFSKYQDGTIALRIFDEYDHPLMTVTKNVPGCSLKKNQILVKNYSENEGILECLEEQEIIERTGMLCSSGFIDLHICNLLIEPYTFNSKEK